MTESTSTVNVPEISKDKRCTLLGDLVARGVVSTAFVKVRSPKTLSDCSNSKLIVICPPSPVMVALFLTSKEGALIFACPTPDRDKSKTLMDDAVTIPPPVERARSITF